MWINFHYDIIIFSRTHDDILTCFAYIRSQMLMIGQCCLPAMDCIGIGRRSWMDATAILGWESREQNRASAFLLCHSGAIMLYFHVQTYFLDCELHLLENQGCNNFDFKDILQSAQQIYCTDLLHNSSLTHSGPVVLLQAYLKKHQKHYCQGMCIVGTQYCFSVSPLLFSHVRICMFVCVLE